MNKFENILDSYPKSHHWLITATLTCGIIYIVLDVLVRQFIVDTEILSLYDNQINVFSDLFLTILTPITVWAMTCSHLAVLAFGCMLCQKKGLKTPNIQTLMFLFVLFLTEQIGNFLEVSIKLDLMLIIWPMALMFCYSIFALKGTTKIIRGAFFILTIATLIHIFGILVRDVFKLASTTSVMGQTILYYRILIYPSVSLIVHVALLWQVWKLKKNKMML